MYKDVERLLGIERGEVHVLCPQGAQSLETDVCYCDAMQGLLMHRGGMKRIGIYRMKKYSLGMNSRKLSGKFSFEMNFEE